MRLAIFLIILFSVGCSKLPPRPVVSFCIIDAPARVLYCKKNVEGAEVETVLLENADKYISTSPDDWKKINDYIVDLKKIVEAKCQ